MLTAGSQPGDAESTGLGRGLGAGRCRGTKIHVRPEPQNVTYSKTESLQKK